jgi:hypothetical protein
MQLHIGEKIKEKAQEKRIGPSELGRMINTSKQNIYSIFRRKTIDTELLLKLSKALDHDFFQLYIERKEVRPDKKSPTVTISKHEIGDLKKELEIYREKCELLEKLNKFLEKEVARLNRSKQRKS